MEWNGRPPSKANLHLYKKPKKEWDWQLFRQPAKRRSSMTVPRAFLATKGMQFRATVANQNGGEWWLARTRKWGVRALELMFLRDKMPRMLTRTVGCLLEHPTLHEHGYLYLQIRVEAPTDVPLIEVSLADCGITLQECVARVDVPIVWSDSGQQTA